MDCKLPCCKCSYIFTVFSPLQGDIGFRGLPGLPGPPGEGLQGPPVTHNFHLFLDFYKLKRLISHKKNILPRFCKHKSRTTSQCIYLCRKPSVILFDIQPDGRDWVILSGELSLCRSRIQTGEKKKGRFILCANMPTTGAFYPKAATSFVQGIYHDFFPQHSDTLVHSVNLRRHMCLMRKHLA